jgi:malate synthase
MSHRHELLDRIRREDESLHYQIETLQREAERIPGGIREFRKQRINQLRAKQEALRTRRHRVERHQDEHWDKVRVEAENLWLDIRDTVKVAENTFH